MPLCLKGLIDIRKFNVWFLSYVENLRATQKLSTKNKIFAVVKE